MSSIALTLPRSGFRLKAAAAKNRAMAPHFRTAQLSLCALLRKNRAKSLPAVRE
jgi:hypothetical protein